MSTGPVDPKQSVTGYTIIGVCTAALIAVGAYFGIPLVVTQTQLPSPVVIAPPQPHHPQPTLPLLKSSQFTVLGYMLSPKDKDPNTANGLPYLYYATGMTCTVDANGKRHFLLTGCNDIYYQPISGGQNNGGQIVDVLETTWSPLASAVRSTFVSASPRASVYGASGIPFGNKQGQSAFDGTNLYWIDFNPYNVTTTDFPCLGMSIRNADGSWTPNGPWYVGPAANQGSKRVTGYTTLCPQYFADGYLFGSRLIAGCGQQSGNVQCCRGSGLYSIQTNQLTSPLNYKPLCFWPKPPAGTPGGMPRDAYFSCPNADVTGADLTVRNPENTASDLDFFGDHCAAVWIRTATSEGILVSGNVAAPGSVVWYGNSPEGTGPTSLVDPVFPGRGTHAMGQNGGASRCPRVVIFDPNVFVQVCLNGKDPGTVTYSEAFDPRTVFNLTGLPEQGYIGGMCIDPVDPSIFYLDTGLPGDNGLPILAKVQVQ